jgi:hypothetical protein
MRVTHCLLVLLLLLSPSARGDPWQFEYLMMPSAQAVGTFDRQAPFTQFYDEVVQADNLFTIQRGPFKLFGEYLLSDHEGDLERLQLGWQLSSDTVIWMGRYHQPSSEWNHEHHHGQYLSTSITRPAAEEWEDLGGILPQHFTGILVESNHAVPNGMYLRTAVAGGLAPQLTSDGMAPFDLVHPDHNRRLAGYQARASIHPSEFADTGFGILAANDELAVVSLPTPRAFGLDHVDLTLVGAFGTYATPSWKIFGTWYYVRAGLDYADHLVHDRFSVGYLQVEKRLGHDFTAFGRVETSVGASDSPYLQLYQEAGREKYIGGLRWDFMQRQALTLQLTKTDTLQGHFADIRFQWCAALF